MSASALTTDLGRLAGGSIHVRTENLPTVAGVPPLAWVEPESAESLAAVLAFCSEAAIPVEPAGAGTWLSAGRPPAAAPLIVSTRRLRQVTEYEPADLVIGVQAGMPLLELSGVLAEHRQMLPLDPPGNSAATVGAAVALSAAGPLRAGHGTPRDVLLGVEMVSGDGRLLRFGGRVVKNVAGYDTVRLMAGSRGSLGIITQMFVLLRSAPPAEATVVCAAGSVEGAVSAAREVHAAMECDALEVLSPSLAAAVGLAASWTVAVRVGGGAAAVEDAVARLTPVLGKREVRRLEEAEARGFRGACSGLEADAAFHVRAGREPAVLADTLNAVLARIAALASETGTDPAVWHLAAHVTAGIVRCWCPAQFIPQVPEDAAALARLLLELRSEFVNVGGTVHYPVMPPRLHERVLAYQAPPEPALRLMQGVKQALDPAGIMSLARHVL